MRVIPRCCKQKPGAFARCICPPLLELDAICRTGVQMCWIVRMRRPAAVRPGVPINPHYGQVRVLPNQRSLQFCH